MKELKRYAPVLNAEAVNAVLAAAAGHPDYLFFQPDHRSQIWAPGVCVPGVPLKKFSPRLVRSQTLPQLATYGLSFGRKSPRIG